MLGGGGGVVLGLLSVGPYFCWGGVGAAKDLLPCFLVPKGNQPTACTLALWWLKFGPTERGGGGGSCPRTGTPPPPPLWGLQLQRNPHQPILGRNSALPHASHNTRPLTPAVRAFRNLLSDAPGLQRATCRQGPRTQSQTWA